MSHAWQCFVVSMLYSLAATKATYLEPWIYLSVHAAPKSDDEM